MSARAVVQSQSAGEAQRPAGRNGGGAPNPIDRQVDFIFRSALTDQALLTEEDERSIRGGITGTVQVYNLFRSGQIDLKNPQVVRKVFELLSFGAKSSIRDYTQKNLELDDLRQQLEALQEQGSDEETDPNPMEQVLKLAQRPEDSPQVQDPMASLLRQVQSQLDDDESSSEEVIGGT